LVLSGSGSSGVSVVLSSRWEVGLFDLKFILQLCVIQVGERMGSIFPAQVGERMGSLSPNGNTCYDLLSFFS
jgi:hypothetical protein